MKQLLLIILLASCTFYDVIAQQISGRKVSKVIRYSARCTEQQIDLSLDFDGPFHGLVYSEGSNCIYVNASLSPQASYIANVPLTGCKTNRRQDGTWENNVIVQHDYNILEATDQKFQVLCAPGILASTDDKFTVSFKSVQVDSNLERFETLTGVGAGGGVLGGAPLQYTVEVQQGLGPNGPKITGPLSVGQAISYVVRLPDPRGQQARIGKCWAEDGISELDLSDENGCSVQNTGNVWNDFQTAQGTGGEKLFFTDIKAWGFPTSNRVNIYCNLHFCPGPCPTYNCRRLTRRDVYYPVHMNTWNAPKTTQVQGGNEVVEVVGGTFEVDNFSYQRTDVLTAERISFSQSPAGVITSDPSDSRSKSGSEICMGRAYFSVGIALLSLIVIISIAFVIMATYRLTHTSKLDDRAMSISSEGEFSNHHSNDNVTFQQNSSWMRHPFVNSSATVA